jgi:hypothetical protein
MDVAKFFLLNYGLHAATVIMEPGSGVLETTVATFQVVLSPYAGMTKALWVIWRCPNLREEPLQQALWAGALCTVVPTKQMDTNWLERFCATISSY